MTPFSPLTSGGSCPAAACRRELAEETGITDVEMGPVVWQRESLFRYRGREHHRFDWVHLARLAGGGRRHRRWTANERTTVLGERWWTLAELHAADRERFLPRRLPALLADVLDGRHSQVIRLYEDTR
jgi:8-oxo-dGTP pyrophosphatase MutT (NUDIX family)